MTPETQDEELHPHVEQLTLESLNKRFEAIEAKIYATPEQVTDDEQDGNNG